MFFEFTCIGILSFSYLTHSVSITLQVRANRSLSPHRTGTRAAAAANAAVDNRQQHQRGASSSSQQQHFLSPVMASPDHAHNDDLDQSIASTRAVETPRHHGDASRAPDSHFSSATNATTTTTAAAGALDGAGGQSWAHDAQRVVLRASELSLLRDANLRASQESLRRSSDLDVAQHAADAAHALAQSSAAEAVATSAEATAAASGGGGSVGGAYSYSSSSSPSAQAATSRPVDAAALDGATVVRHTFGSGSMGLTFEFRPLVGLNVVTDAFGPAAAAGVKRGDRIAQINGQDLAGFEDDDGVLSPNGTRAAATYGASSSSSANANPNANARSGRSSSPQGAFAVDDEALFELLLDLPRPVTVTFFRPAHPDLPPPPPPQPLPKASPNRGPTYVHDTSTDAPAPAPHVGAGGAGNSQKDLAGADCGGGNSNIKASTSPSSLPVTPSADGPARRLSRDSAAREVLSRGYGPPSADAAHGTEASRVETQPPTAPTSSKEREEGASSSPRGSMSAADRAANARAKAAAARAAQAAAAAEAAAAEAAAAEEAAVAAAAEAEKEAVEREASANKPKASCSPSPSSPTSPKDAVQEAAAATVAVEEVAEAEGRDPMEVWNLIARSAF